MSCVRSPWRWDLSELKPLAARIICYATSQSFEKIGGGGDGDDGGGFWLVRAGQRGAEHLFVFFPGCSWETPTVNY